MAFDGEIRFNTRINNSNVQKDLNKVEGEIRKSQNSIVSDVDKSVKRVSGKLGGLTSVVQKLGAAIASVFAVQQIVMFVKDSSQAAMNLSNALNGLQSILEGQGRSFSKAKSFIEEYTKDGLIPATNAITAYKNLASRGYDDTQIRQVMTALKDASAYGRQASMTMGDAVQSATEGLKNENSILVDNAGVTKNVAKMWEEYAASIGTTANNLTQQQKIQAEVNGILEETKFQTGDAAKVAGNLSGQLQQLSFNFNNLKIAIGNVINPIVQMLLPTINAAIQVMTQFANAVASVVGALFGKASVQASTLASANESIAATASAGAAAEKELADATTAAGKAAKKSLASFDEINKLQDSTGSGGGSASGSVGGGGVSSTSNTTADTEVEDSISPKIQAIVDKIKEMVEPLKAIDFTPLRTSLTELGEAFAEFGSIVGDSLEWAWFNILVPLSQFSIEKGGPKSVDLLTSAFKFLQSILKPVITGLGNLLEALEPVFTFVGDIEQIQILPISSAQTFTVADTSGDIAVIECCSEKVTIINPSESNPYVCATNSFHAKVMGDFNVPGIDNWQAEHRYETLVSSLEYTANELDIEMAIDLLSGKQGFLCQYDRKTGKDTVWSVVYDLKNKKIFRTEGNPSRRKFKEDTRFRVLK